MRLCSYKQTKKDKIKDLGENLKIDERLIKHYTFVLEHFDEVIASHDKDIAEVEEKKAEVLRQFIAAPQQLIELGNHLVKMQEKLKAAKGAISNMEQKKKRIKNLRERLAILEEECKAEGINVNGTNNKQAI